VPEVEDRLRSIADDGRAWVAIGTVDTIEEHAAWGVLLNCVVQPDGREVQARVVRWGAGAAIGAEWPVSQDDEVLLVFPGGDVNQALAIPGLASRRAPVPSSFDNAHPEIVHPGGLTLRTTQAGAIHAVVLESILEKLEAVLDEVIAIGLAMTSGPSVPVPTPAAVALKTEIAAGLLHRSTALSTE
jgi:hypothetical protein